MEEKLYQLRSRLETLQQNSDRVSATDNKELEDIIDEIKELESDLEKKKHKDQRSRFLTIAFRVAYVIKEYFDSGG